MICVSESELEIILDILRKHAPDCEARVFGSRYKWTPKEYSDLDIALVGKGKTGVRFLGAIREAFEESNLPYRVDVLDWFALTPEFQAIIEQGYEVIYSPRMNRGNTWRLQRLSDFMQFNAQTSLAKGTFAKKVSMEHLIPFNRKIQGYQDGVYSGGTKFRNGDTLVARITPCLENGKTAYVDILRDDEIAFGSTEFIVLSENPGISDSKFVFYLAVSNDFRETAIQLMTGTSGRQRVETEALKEKEFYLPPLPTQRAIAATLSCLDDKIELNNRINANLEAQAQAIFKSWFVDFEPWGGMQPDKWKTVKIGTLCESVSKTHSYNKDRLIFLNTGDIENGLFLHATYSPVYMMPGQAKKSIQHNDILYSEIRPINRHFAFVNFDAPNYIVSTKLMVIRANGIDSRRLYHYLTSECIITELQTEAESRSGTFPQIRFENIQQMDILIATPDIEGEFSNLLHDTYKTIDSNNAESTCLAAIRDALLPRLMSGEIEVKEA